MTNLHFKHELIIPEINQDIYTSIYEIENWLRRITHTAYMVHHGKGWTSTIDPNLFNKINSRLNKNTELFYLSIELSNNLLWATLHRELHQLMFEPNIWPIVAQLTGFGKDRLQSKLLELNDIRNLLAHNRAFSLTTKSIFDGLYTSLRLGIANFINTIIYPEINILSNNDPDPFNVIYQTSLARGRNPDEQTFFAKNKYYYDLVCLPIPRAGNWISARKLLKQYKHRLDSIIAFNINKLDDEYSVIMPHNITTPDALENANIFTSNPNIWCNTPYDEQDPAFITHPQIWFYENCRTEPEC